MKKDRTSCTVQTDVLELVVRRELPPFFAHRLTHAIQAMLERERERERIESGRQQGSLDWLDLNALITEVVESMRPQLGQHTVSLRLAHVLPILQGNRDKLMQAITYLLNNAIECKPQGGEICVTSYAKGAMMHVCIHHHGSAMSSNVVEHLLAQDMSTSIETINTLPATASSLPTACRIMKMHGGQLWAENIPGEGRNFHFTLPITR